MNLSRAIGGYFELELRPGSFPYQDAVLVNSGRAGFEYILRTHNVSRVFMPKYTCDVMLEPLKRLQISYEFYNINNALELATDIALADSELLVYTNYFGIKDAYCQELSKKYQTRVVFDFSQAFFSQPLTGSHTFYSPRKFFGLPDGGMVYTDSTLAESLPEGISYEHFSHLIKRIDLGAEVAYEDFKRNDAALSEVPMSKMSPLTRRLLESIDYDNIGKRRQENFAFLHANLGKKNKLPINTEGTACPMVYPFCSDNPSLRKKLIDKKIFVATYWPNVFEWCQKDEIEYKLAEGILPLPIDQRYSREDMEKIVGVING